MKPDANKSDVLKVDRNCLSCSGNMAQTMHQLKIACLSYTSAPILYQGNQFKLTDLLALKAKVIADCSRLLRSSK